MLNLFFSEMSRDTIKWAGVICIYIKFCVSELALVTHKPRAATAYSVGKTKCAGKILLASSFVCVIRFKVLPLIDTL